ncbi:MAG: DUF6503 family protein [Flavobacteriaceae bacterium]
MEQYRIARHGVFTIVLILFLGCRGERPMTSAQEMVDKAIAYSGGEDRYRNTHITFDFRDISYAQLWDQGKRVMKRRFLRDSLPIEDILSGQGLERLVNGARVSLPDTLAKKYSNSVNSVHYFAYLPFGLNDPAVRKEFVGLVNVGGKPYYKVKVTFAQKNGGDDFEDTYLYWFDTADFSTDYLAYEYHVDGGGIRFREAYNERRVGGIRFVDYRNYKPKEPHTDLGMMDSLYEKGQLTHLSTIELRNISVQDNYN